MKTSWHIHLNNFLLANHEHQNYNIGKTVISYSVKCHQLKYSLWNLDRQTWLLPWKATIRDDVVVEGLYRGEKHSLSIWLEAIVQIRHAQDNKVAQLRHHILRPRIRLQEVITPIQSHHEVAHAVESQLLSLTKVQKCCCNEYIWLMVAYLGVKIIIGVNQSHQLVSVWLYVVIFCPQTKSNIRLVTNHDLVYLLVLLFHKVFIVTTFPSTLDNLLFLENEMRPEDFPLSVCDTLCTKQFSKDSATIKIIQRFLSYPYLFNLKVCQRHNIILISAFLLLRLGILWSLIWRLAGPFIPE